MVGESKTVEVLPYLRRYARAVTGDQKTGDALVLAALASLPRHGVHSSVVLFRAFSQAWNGPVGSYVRSLGRFAAEDLALQRLGRMTPLPRQAFLRTAMEGFNAGEAAEILGLDINEIGEALRSARNEVMAQVATRVLIIEDELFIAADLEDLMHEMGHEVVGIARTRTDAVRLAALHQPGLVLADIQLADGSSGIDAANEILARMEVPVIFISSYPERLLTGLRPEPTFLIKKPFQAELVRVVSSQALFFGTKAHPGVGEAMPIPSGADLAEACGSTLPTRSQPTGA